jgi:hypothetical protein
VLKYQIRLWVQHLVDNLSISEEQHLVRVPGDRRIVGDGHHCLAEVIDRAPQ